MINGLNMEITMVPRDSVSFKAQLLAFASRLASGDLPSEEPVGVKAAVGLATVYACEALRRQLSVTDLPGELRLEDVCFDEDETVWQVILSFADTAGVREYRRVRLGYVLGELRGIAPYDPLGTEI